jgi:hypothetical protein
MRLNAWVGILLIVALGASSGLPWLCVAHCGSHASVPAQDRPASQVEIASQDAACTACAPGAGENSLRASDCTNLRPLDLLVEPSFSLTVQRDVASLPALPSAVHTIHSFNAVGIRDPWCPTDTSHGVASPNIFPVTLRI